MLQRLFSNSLDVLQKNLDLRLIRHQVLTSNVANAETPGYVAKDVRFEEALQQAVHFTAQSTLRRTNPRHLPQPQRLGDVQGTLVVSPSDDVGRDRNSVSVDREMAELTTNTLQYNASAEILSRMFDQLKRTISDGGR
ncbi:MAG TPA: flagellar basal body rod protein FlgB [Candidatus Tectomicrobia bacterium]|jgi:flagellar basal-body rod protein FlgB